MVRKRKEKPSPYIHHVVKRGLLEWQTFRHMRITASVAAACLGLSRWLSPQKAYRMIVGEEKSESDWYHENGRDMEPLAVELYEKQTGTICEPGGFWQPVAYPFLGASPDRLVSGGGIATIKTSAKQHPCVDIEWRVQAQAEMICTGAPWCDVVWLNEAKIRVWRVYPAGHAWLIRKLGDFWYAYVKTRKQPERGEVRRWPYLQLKAATPFVRSVSTPSSSAKSCNLSKVSSGTTTGRLG